MEVSRFEERSTYKYKSELGQLRGEIWLKSSLYMYKTDRNYGLWYADGETWKRDHGNHPQVKVVSP